MRKWLAAPTRITTTILASLGQIELHLTAIAPNAEEAHRALDGAVADVSAALGRDLFSTNGETMQQVVGELLRARGFRIAAAESCTGGLVMARLTEVPGSSDYVDRGVVVYSNQSKIDLLGVPPALIARTAPSASRWPRPWPAGWRASRAVISPSASPASRVLGRHAGKAGRHGRDSGGVGAQRRRSRRACARSTSSADARWSGFRHRRPRSTWSGGG